MKEKYLKGVCSKIAYTLFDESMSVFGYPHRAEDIRSAKSLCYSQLLLFNEKERELIKDTLDLLFRDYKNEVSYFEMMYK